MQDDISRDEFILPLLWDVQEYVSICNSCKIANYSLQLSRSDRTVEHQDIAVMLLKSGAVAQTRTASFSFHKPSLLTHDVL